MVELRRGVRPWAWAVIGGVGVAIFCGGVRSCSMKRSRDGPRPTEDAEGLLPSRWSPFASVAALKRIDERFGDRLAPERRGELRTAIADIERRYFGPTENRANRTLKTWFGRGCERPLRVDNWVFEESVR